jgi:HPt (histidine-containing phosphotransfer) domain-containing protein
MITSTNSARAASGSKPGVTSPWITAGGSHRPLLDHEVLDRLREDLREYDVWRVFVQNFIAALPLRIEKLRAALTTGDAAGARDAVLSLKTASQMVGAERLAALAMDLEAAQREAARIADPSVSLPGLAVSHLTRIRQRAEQTSDALQAHLATASPPRMITSQVQA